MLLERFLNEKGYNIKQIGNIEFRSKTNFALKGKRIKNENLRRTDRAVIPPEILLFSLKCQILLANINIHTEIYIEFFITLIELNLVLS